MLCSAQRMSYLTHKEVKIMNDSPNPPAMLGRLEEVVTGVLK